MSELLDRLERDALLAGLRERSRIDYLQALLMPGGARDTFVILRSFHAELLDIVRKANEAPLAEIRLQWWADGVLGLREGEVGSHPIGSAVLRYLSTRPHARKTLATKVEAHSADLYADAPFDRAEVEGLGGETRSVLTQLVVSEIGEAASYTVSSGHAGVAELVADRIVAVPHLLRKGFFPLPQDILGACETSAEQWLAGEGGCDEATRSFAQFGLEHVAKARDGMPEDGFRKPFAHLAVVEASLEKAVADPRAARERGVEIGPLRMQWLLWRA